MQNDDLLEGARVLVVEDTWHVAMALKSALTDTGMVVVGPARTSADAKRLVAEQQPEFVLMDLILNGEMASELVEWLSERGLRVVLMSGLAVVPKSIGQHAAFLQKPFGADELLRVMRATIRRRSDDPR